MANEVKIKHGLLVDGTSNVLEVQGTLAQLFSITDDLTGDLLSVSDISGIPILNVNSNGTSYFDGDVGFGTSSSSNIANGSVYIQNTNLINTYIKVGHKTGSTSGADFLACYYNGTQIGGVAQNGTTGVSFNVSSDYRLKEDLQSFNGLDMISDILVYDYRWKSDKSRSYGVMAHELQEVLPQAVTGEKDAEKMQAVDYSKIIPLLVKSIQELKEEIESLKLNNV